MLQTEFVKNLNCNYVRILLDKKPEENRYQYCIVTRGGVKGMLPCSLRYINGMAYLYYDISSLQSVPQLHEQKKIGRQWVKDFLWSMRRIQQEMDRFLLDDGNLLWNPENIYQDLEKNDFYFLYYPYYEGDRGFLELLDYLVEHIDYEDDVLVECVYRMHEQFALLGDVYLTGQIYEDGRQLEKEIQQKEPEQSEKEPEIAEKEAVTAETIREQVSEAEKEKKGIRYFLEGKLRKQREDRENIRRQTRQMMSGYAVCEDSTYVGAPKPEEPRQGEDDELGKTVYMEAVAVEEPTVPCLYFQDGKLAAKLENRSVILGKKKEEADCIVDDASVSRMHARITREKEGYYLEDLNSTNGTWKNGLHLQPYEKRRLEKEDEIKLGKVVLIFR